jgi:hypothetical protein
LEKVDDTIFKKKPTETILKAVSERLKYSALTLNILEDKNSDDKKMIRNPIIPITMFINKEVFIISFILW